MNDCCVRRIGLDARVFAPLAALYQLFTDFAMQTLVEAIDPVQAVVYTLHQTKNGAENESFEFVDRLR